jgi:predicted acyl esterase
MQVKTVQYGLGSRGPKNPVTGAPACGAETLSDAELARNRSDFGAEIRAHPFDDAYHRERSAQWDKIQVPFLSAANWGGQGLHPRGNFEGFMRAASQHKWLEVHGLEHWTEFYTDYGIDLQKRFFDHFLKGAANGWEQQPRVKLQVRHVDRFVERDHDAWPLPNTQWTRFYLDTEAMALTTVAPLRPAQRSFAALGEGLTFLTEPLQAEIEITGPSALKLRVASSTADADLFVVLRVFDADGEEIVFQGAIDPHTPVGQGWLRASHRKLDADLTAPWRPYQMHDEHLPLIPGEPVDLHIEIWPTSIVVPAGFRIGLSVRGKDYEYAKASGARMSNFKNELRGCGPFLHNDPEDRPAALFGGETTIHLAAEFPAELLLPVIPPA